MSGQLCMSLFEAYVGLTQPFLLTGSGVSSPETSPGPLDRPVRKREFWHVRCVPTVVVCTAHACICTFEIFCAGAAVAENGEPIRCYADFEPSRVALGRICVG